MHISFYLQVQLLYKLDTVHFKENCPLLDLGGFFFRTRTQVKAETSKASRPLSVYECGKRSFPYSIMLSSFVWNVRYLTCTTIELVTKLKYACFWFFSILSFFFALYRKLIDILREHLTCIKGEIINRKLYSNLVMCISILSQ